MLAVALREPGEDAEDLGGALGAQYGEGRLEFAAVEGPRCRAQRAVMREECIGLVESNVHAGILQHRGQIIGRVAQHAILRVDEPDAS